MIELKGLSKTYVVSGDTIRALQPVDITFQRGEFVSIVGHSGSGKSTLLSLIGGIARPDTGTVIIDGINIHDCDDTRLSRLRNEKFGFIYQFASLVPSLTAVENVLLPSVFGSKRTKTDAVSLLALVGLADKAGRYPAELSGGEQQRVAIARAFIQNVDIVLADEPTGDLDEETESEIMAFFEQINKKRKVTVIIVTHSSEIALRAGTRLRMRQGVLEHLS